jgi:hypothetical protein
VDDLEDDAALEIDDIATKAEDAEVDDVATTAAEVESVDEQDEE